MTTSDDCISKVENAAGHDGHVLSYRLDSNLRVPKLSYLSKEQTKASDLSIYFWSLTEEGELKVMQSGQVDL